MKQRHSLAAAWVFGLLVVAMVGCQPDDSISTPKSSVPATTASATPTPTPTPTETPISSEEALYNEALKVIDAYRNVDLEITRQGGADSLPPAMAPYVSDPYASVLEGQYRNMKQNNLKVRDLENATIRWERPAAKAYVSATAVELCSDSTGVQVQENGGEWGPGGKFQMIFYFKRSDAGGLVIFKAHLVQQGDCES